MQVFGLSFVQVIHYIPNLTEVEFDLAKVVDQEVGVAESPMAFFKSWKLQACIMAGKFFPAIILKKIYIIKKSISLSTFFIFLATITLKFYMLVKTKFLKKRS
ncbi:hypothetical protein BH10BAC3_BH10BAC3_09960 [soil metagenome]